MGTCGGPTVTTLKTSSASWVNEDYQTISEITPDSFCGSLAYYEGILSNIASYMESNTSDPGRYWGGFMLDLEPGFGFSAANLTTLASDATSLMSGEPGMSFWFDEDQPNAFTATQYNSLVSAGGYAAPQVYEQTFENTVHYECTTYHYCDNIVTECLTATDCGTTTGWPGWTTAIDNTGGAPSTILDWGSNYWFNMFAGSSPS